MNFKEMWELAVMQSMALIGDEEGKAQRGGAVQAIIVVGATIFIGIKIISEIIKSITGLTGTANSTFNDVVTYLWIGIGFLGLGLLVLGAVYILRIIGSMDSG